MQQRIEDRDIWPKLLQDKDDLSLREMSERYGVAASAIVAAFKRQNISRRPAPSGPRSYRRKEEGRPAKAARRSKRGKRTSGRATRPPAPRPHTKDTSILPFWSDLGTVADEEVARRARVSAAMVQEFRQVHGIPAPDQKKAAPAPSKAAKGTQPPRKKAPRETPSVRRSREIRAKLEPFDHLIGKLPDSEIARLSGLSLQAVRHQRQRRNIQAAGKLPRQAIQDILVQEGLAAPAPQKEAKPAEAAPEAAAPAAPAPAAPAPSPTEVLTERQAWRVTFDRGERSRGVIIVAPSFLDAARLAEHHANGGRVSSVEALGPAIAS